MPWDDMNPEQKAETEFCVFKAPEWGFRAMAKILLTYAEAHFVKTIAEAITRWAPPSENDTAAYIARVCELTGIGPNAKVDFHSYKDAFPIIKAIAEQECGGWMFTNEELISGLALADIKP